MLSPFPLRGVTKNPDYNVVPPSPYVSSLSLSVSRYFIEWNQLFFAPYIGTSCCPSKKMFRIIKTVDLHNKCTQNNLINNLKCCIFLEVIDRLYFDA